MLLNILRWVKTQRDRLYFFFGVRDRLKWPSPLSLSLSISFWFESFTSISLSITNLDCTQQNGLLAGCMQSCWALHISDFSGKVGLNLWSGNDRARRGSWSSSCQKERRPNRGNEIQPALQYIDRKGWVSEWVSAVLEGQYNNRNRAEW